MTRRMARARCPSSSPAPSCCISRRRPAGSCPPVRAGSMTVIQWVMWQMANQGPKTGECGHFRRLKDTEGDQSYAVARFTDEVNRFYGRAEQSALQPAIPVWVMSTHIAGHDLLSVDGELGRPGSVTSTNSNTSSAGSRNWVTDPQFSGAWRRVPTCRMTTPGCPKRRSKKLRALLYNQRARPAPDTGGLEA